MRTDGIVTAPSRRIRITGAAQERALPEEVPIALVHNGSTFAVMMASPCDLEDFAWGFALTEGVAGHGDLGPVEIVEHAEGIEARMWLPQSRIDAINARRRAMVGPVGCGLCGIDSLAEASRSLPPVADAVRMKAADVGLALDELRNWQPLHDETHAVHGAGFYLPGTGIALAREDVGRHNALDKLIGAMARAGIDGRDGAIVLSSRISVEMVQKAAMAGIGVVCAVSAPTAHAVRVADGAGITVVARTRGAVQVFTHPHRITETPHVV